MFRGISLQDYFELKVAERPRAVGEMVPMIDSGNCKKYYSVAVPAKMPQLLRNMRQLLFALLVAVGVPNSATAGGSFLDVEVREFVRLSDIEYRMTVAPTQKIKRSFPDPYMGKCPLLTVVGTFRKTDGSPDRKAHVEALLYVEAAHKEKRNMNFGWMGQGLFVIDAAKPCMVKSRSLRIYNGMGNTAIMSYYAKV